MLLFLPNVAHASIGDAVMESSCPACGGKVCWALSDTHPVLWIPLERDLRGPEHFHSFVTCEKCFYSGTPAEFETSLTPEFLRIFQLSSMNLPRDAKLSKERYWEVYLARETGRIRGDSPQKQTFVSLNLAWHIRIWSATFSDPALSGQAYRALPDYEWFDFNHPADRQEQWKRMEIDFSTSRDPERRRALSIALASQLSFLGEYDYLLQLLPRLEGLPPVTAERVRGIRDLERSLALEPALQDALLALEDPRTKKSAEMVYLIAELHRRLGNFDLARGWYEKALARSDLNPRLRQWIPEQLQLMNGPEKQYSPLLPVMALAMLFSFLGWQCCPFFLIGEPRANRWRADTRRSR